MDWKEELDPVELNKIEEIISLGLRIPSPPQLLFDIERTLSDPDANTNKLTQLIKGDAGLTASIFELSSSPSYGAGVEVKTLEGALLRLGQNELLNITRGALLKKAIGGNGPMLERFWERSQAIAQISAALALRNGVKWSFDTAYLAGLFHDCGVPILMQRFPDYGKAIGLEKIEAWTNLYQEDARLGADHSLVGYFIAHNWHLPEDICKAILYHHRPDEASGDTVQHVAILRLASNFFSQLISGRDNPEWESRKKGVLNALGIPEEEYGSYTYLGDVSGQPDEGADPRIPT